MFQRNILSELIKISHEAGIIIMDIYRNKFEVNHKNDNSPVTNADRNAEDFILKKLKKIFPDIPIISEEAYSNKFIPDYDKNLYNVNIEFYVVNTPTELVDMSVMLERLR